MVCPMTGELRAAAQAGLDYVRKLGSNDWTAPIEWSEFNVIA